MKTFSLFFGLLLGGLISSCTSPKSDTASPSSGPMYDPVCNMKISDQSEAYHYKYQGKTYYFDSNNCKSTFKMNPEKFIHNSCNQASK